MKITARIRHKREITEYISIMLLFLVKTSSEY
jgi:hypothetical protein